MRALIRSAVLAALSSLALSLAGIAAHAADDSGIYPPGVPADSAFVRVVDLSGAGGAEAQIDNLSVPIGANASTTYQVLTPGKHTITLGSQSIDLEAEPSSAYTIALDTTGARAAAINKDLMANDPAKATIALYNYTDEPITLTALAKEVPVFEAVAPGAAGQREMNPVGVDLKVKAAAAVVEEFPGFAIQPRSLVSFFVFGSGGALAVKSDVARGDH
jgi:hypothetical protein